MKLYYDPASRSSRIVTFFLHDNRIPFEEEIVTLAGGDQHTPSFLAINPNGEVPVLVDDDGFVVTQSASIIRYIADKFELAVYPRELRGRLRVDEAIDWFQTGFYVFHCVLQGYTYILPQFLELESGVLHSMRDLGKPGVEKYLKVLDRHMIGTSPYVCGDRITLADYVGAANITLGAFADIDLSPFANVERWLDNLAKRSAWSLAYAGFEGLLVAFRARGKNNALPGQLGLWPHAGEAEAP